jgi:hypothetical protein
MSRSSGFVAAFMAVGVCALVFAAPSLAEDVMGGSSEVGPLLFLRHLGRRPLVRSPREGQAPWPSRSVRARR